MICLCLSQATSAGRSAPIFFLFSDWMRLFVCLDADCNMCTYRMDEKKSDNDREEKERAACQEVDCSCETCLETDRQESRRRIAEMTSQMVKPGLMHEVFEQMKAVHRIRFPDDNLVDIKAKLPRADSCQTLDCLNKKTAKSAHCQECQKRMRAIRDKIINLNKKSPMRRKTESYKQL